MRAFSTTAVLESPMASNRRQPVRQTRTNPARSATNAAPTQGSFGGPHDNRQVANPGFFPAITHFTDSITALPKEMVRHYTMLKEVDAKIYGPEEILKELVTTALDSPVPPRKPAPLLQRTDSARLNDGKAPDSTIPTVTGIAGSARSHKELQSQPQSKEVPDPASLPRRRLFRDLRMVMGEMLMTLDEKNHVMSTAIDGLDKQLKRCESSYPHIESEISEEARYGSLNHWAYTEKAAEKKGTTASERTRREVASAHHQGASTTTNHETEGIALRSELRREAMAARKQRNQHIDSDFDDSRGAGQPAPKKPQATGKGRKTADAVSAANGAGVGLCIGNGATPTAPPSKRRKTEKSSTTSTTGGLPMERAMGSVYGSNGGSTRGTAGSPRETPAVEAAKKRGRGAAAANGTARRRANTNTSVVQSPSMASSPVVGTFPTAKDVHHKSPAPSLIQRAQPSRARQNSNQSVPQDIRIRPSSAASNVTTNGNGMLGITADVTRISSLIGRSVADIKTTFKEAVNYNGEHLIEDTGDGAGDLRGALLIASGGDHFVEKEEVGNVIIKTNRADRPRSISISTRGAGKTSKTSTPLHASFPEPQRSRPSRTIETIAKRSHKKGAGLAAQLAAAAAINDEEGSSMQGDEDEEEDDSEPTYCYCDQVSYGEMVACDMATCRKEWFHLDCVGLSKAPTKNAKWYCDDCKENLKRGKFNGGSSR